MFDQLIEKLSNAESITTVVIIILAISFYSNYFLFGRYEKQVDQNRDLVDKWQKDSKERDGLFIKTLEAIKTTGENTLNVLLNGKK